jgi:hypothetical protein
MGIRTRYLPNKRPDKCRYTNLLAAQNIVLIASKQLRKMKMSGRCN